MDKSVALIADFAHAVRFEDLPPAVVHHCKRCMIDAFGCALGGLDGEPSRIALKMAQRSSMDAGARVIGTRWRALPELAAFANGVMTRYLDGNDSFVGNGGHPSDTIAGILAAADSRRTDGRTIITAMGIAYEICYNLWKSMRAPAKGIDHSLYITLASAVGAAKVLGLGRNGIVQTVSLAITPNVSLHATRHGHLSIWKGCAGGNAARNGVFAALLAEAGVTGPEKPVEDRHGLQNLVGNFELLPFAGVGRAFSELSFKRFLSFTHGQSPITAALPLSRQVAADDIDKVTVYTYRVAWEINGKDREKWHPATRETADHSIPYMVAAVLVERDFNDDIFADARLHDPRIRALLDKLELKEDPELTRQFPGKNPCRIEIITRSGEREVSQTDNARGHYNNPMTDEEVCAKFRDLARRALPQQRIDRALAALWQLDTTAHLDVIFDAVEIGR